MAVILWMTADGSSSCLVALQLCWLDQKDSTGALFQKARVSPTPEFPAAWVGEVEIVEHSIHFEQNCRDRAQHAWHTQRAALGSLTLIKYGARYLPHAAPSESASFIAVCCHLACLAEVEAVGFAGVSSGCVLVVCTAIPHYGEEQPKFFFCVGVITP